VLIKPRDRPLKIEYQICRVINQNIFGGRASDGILVAVAKYDLYVVEYGT
jgi:hypothetical protein